MVRWTGKVRPGLRQQLASSIDIAPTVLRACGLEAPRQMEGLDLVDLSSGRGPERPRLFGESYAHDIADLDDPRKTLLYRWCIEDNWKLLVTYDGTIGRYTAVHPQTSSSPLLFDLLADPHETVDLSRAHPDVVTHLQGQLDAHWK